VQEHARETGLSPQGAIKKPRSSERPGASPAEVVAAGIPGSSQDLGRNHGEAGKDRTKIELGGCWDGAEGVDYSGESSRVSAQNR
jgi:hypothetical protein